MFAGGTTMRSDNSSGVIEDNRIIFFILAIVAGIGILVFGFAAPLFTQQSIEIKVIEKIPYHDGQYLITAEWYEQAWDTDYRSLERGMPINITHREVFTVSDEWILLKFDASDRYMTLETGKTYRVKVCGYRFQLFSWYRNIFEILGEIQP